MTGAVTDVTLKLPLVDAVPPGVVTEIGPSVAPAGTLAMICVPVPLTKKGVPVPLNCTALAPPKFAPLIVTLVPTGPLVGLNPVKLGGVPAAAGSAEIEITSATIAADAPARANDRVPIDVRFMMTLPGSIRLLGPLYYKTSERVQGCFSRQGRDRVADRGSMG